MTAMETRTRLVPMADRVVVERVQGEETTPGDIVLPDNAREKPNEGIVIAVGPGRVLYNGNIASMPLRVGDRVLFSRYGGAEVEREGRKLTVLRLDDVMTKVEEA